MAGYRWGILGTGGIARAFARDLGLAGLRVTAVGSRTRAAAAAFAAELGVGHAHGSYAELCADPEVDVVYVATPHPFHREHALLALRAGKAALVEKPFALDAAEARSMVAEAKARGLFLMEAMWTRFLPGMAELRALLADGAVGDPVALLADHAQDIPMERAPRLHLPELGGGALLDLGVYPVSFAHDLFGPPARVAAAGRLTERGVDAAEAVSLAWEGGATASLFSTMEAAGPNRAVVLGTRGRVELGPWWFTDAAFEVRDASGEVTRSRAAGERGRGLFHEAVEVERRLDEGAVESPLMSHRGSVEVMETLDRVREILGVRYPGK